MAKGRKLTFTRSDRFLDTFNNYNGYTTTNQENTLTAELLEHDVWSTIDDNTTHHHLHEDHHSHAQSEWPSRATSMNGFRHARNVGGLSLAFDDDGDDVGGGGSCNGNTGSSRVVHQFKQSDSVRTSRGRHHVASSAPVNVPDWSKIYRVDSVESMHDSDGDDGDQGETEMIPPHEYLARSRKSAATSVFEGVGRTLKGRDLRRVRDAVWRQTGFDG